MSRRIATVGLAAAALAAAAGSAQAATTQVPISTAKSHLLAAFPNDRLGDSVAATGDVNGDGRMDFVVGAPFASNLNRAASGTAYVIYGRTAPFTIDLRTLTAAQGFRIDGPSANSRAGWDVAAGDINGDGRFDVVVGAPGADSRGRIDNGSAFVIFGRKGTNANVNLAALGTRGFRIDGSRSSDRAGESVSVARGINLDPRADVVVGAPARTPTASRTPAPATSSSARSRRAPSTCARWARWATPCGARSAAARSAPRSPRWATSTATGSTTSHWAPRASSAAAC